MILHLPPSVPHDVPLLVAYSGGADSRLLLSLAKTYGDTHGVSVYAAHLHHGIRGDEADRDLNFCRRTAAELRVPLFEKRVDVPALSKASGQSLELTAREQRYLFFREIMEENNIPLLLTAHHADDQLETLLFRFLRGSGTKGMGGIPEVRQLDYGYAVRPLLSMTKAEILSACHDLGLDYVTDSTNESPFTARNRLRGEVIPVLESLMGQGIPQQAAERLSRAAREDDDCLTALAEAHIYRHIRPDGGLPLERLQDQPPAIAKRAAALLYEQVTASANSHDGSGTLSALHLESLYTLIQKGVPESALSLPRSTEARIRDAALFIRSVDEERPLSAPTPLWEGDTPWDEGRFLIRITDTPPGTDPRADEHLIADACFPAESLPLPLYARPRASGDVILNHGMHKKLKKLLCDKSIPRHLRDRLPLICYGRDMTPLWYPNVAFADGFPPPANGKAWYIRIIKTKN